MLDFFTWLKRFFPPAKRNPLLLADRSQIDTSPIASEDLATVWDLLAPTQRETLAQIYSPLDYDGAMQRLDATMQRLWSHGAIIRGAYLATPDASAALDLPGQSVALLKLYNELPKPGRIDRYAPMQRWKQDGGFLWLIVLLADETGFVPMRERWVPVPKQPTYPPPTQVKPEPEPAMVPPIEQDDEVTILDAPEPEPEPAAEAPQPTPAPAKIAPAVITPTSEMDDWLRSALAETNQAPRIKLSQILQSDNLAFIGAKGSGKTTLLMTACKYRQGEVIVIDPHASPGKWPRLTIGGGRKWAVIRKALAALSQKMQGSFDQLNSGQRSEGFFAKPDHHCTLVADEFLSLAVNLPPIRERRERGVVIEQAQPGVGDYLVTRLTEGRKVGQCVMTAAQNDTLSALGLPGGMADIKFCFDWIVYCGGLGIRRYSSTRPKSEWLVELQQMERPLIVRDTEHEQWYILDFDLDPVFPLKGGDDEIEDEQPATQVINESPSQRPMPQSLSPEQLVQEVAKRLRLDLPLALNRVDDPMITPLLTIGVSRNLSVRQLAHLLFDAGANGRFKQQKLGPRLEALTAKKA